MNKQLWGATVLFFGKMVNKLIHQKMTHGYTGWNHTSSIVNEKLLIRLHANLADQDWVDVANIAMILDYRENKKLDKI